MAGNSGGMSRNEPSCAFRYRSCHFLVSSIINEDCFPCDPATLSIAIHVFKVFEEIRSTRIIDLELENSFYTKAATDAESMMSKRS